MQNPVVDSGKTKFIIMRIQITHINILVVTQPLDIADMSTFDPEMKSGIIILKSSMLNLFHLMTQIS